MQETPPIEMELRKLGLKEKEARVYLAVLALGPSSVQDIAKEANISRPTAYEIIKILEKKGLVAATKKAKKRYFSAQSPGQILGILRTQKKEIEEKEREFIRIIASLESKYSPKENEEIKLYKGKEGIKALEEILSFTQSAEIFVFSSNANSTEIKKRQAIYQQIRKRLGKIEVKEILPKNLKIKNSQAETKTFSLTDFIGTLILFDKAIFLSAQKPEGFLIENELTIHLLKALFLALWKVV